MPKRSSIRERLELLEKEHRFLTWVLSYRFIESLTVNELEAFAHDNSLPDPAPNRLSRLEGLDRNSLLKLWEEQERLLEYRSSEDLKHFCTHGRWPEELGRLKYSHKDGNISVELEKAEAGELTNDRTACKQEPHGGNV